MKHGHISRIDAAVLTSVWQMLAVYNGRIRLSVCNTQRQRQSMTLTADRKWLARAVVGGIDCTELHVVITRVWWSSPFGPFKMRNVCSIGATARARLVPLSLTIVSVHDLSVHFYTAEFGVNERASEIYVRRTRTGQNLPCWYASTVEILLVSAFESMK